MGLIKITSDMSETERLAAYNSNMQYLEKDLPLKNLPIGIIISFATNVNPNELYGGTWQRIKGAFIWGIDDGETAGVTGGEKTHTLTTDEMPSHVHVPNRWVQVMSPQGNSGSLGGDGNKTGSRGDFSRDAQDYDTQATGGGQAHNNMPPYYGAYIWRRTA